MEPNTVMKNGRLSHLQVRLSPTEGPPKSVTIHKLVAEAFLPPPAPGQYLVRHRDGNPANNHFTNLLWGTQKDNMADAIGHGTTLKGLKNPNAKLTPRMVEVAKFLTTEDFSCAKVAELFDVSPETVRRACRGESWVEAKSA